MQAIRTPPGWNYRVTPVAFPRLLVFSLLHFWFPFPSWALSTGTFQSLLPVRWAPFTLASSNYTINRPCKGGRRRTITIQTPLAPLFLPRDHPRKLLTPFAFVFDATQLVPLTNDDNLAEATRVGVINSLPHPRKKDTPHGPASVCI